MSELVKESVKESVKPSNTTPSVEAPQTETHDPVAHAIARYLVKRASGPSANRRLRRLHAAADAGFDTWEEYRGER